MEIRQIIEIATGELRIIIREKTFLVLLAVFFVMTLFSAYIGWSTQTIVTQVYHSAIIYLKHSGAPHLPQNPFTQIPTLSIVKNMMIYIFLIGALMAIVLGHRSFMRERTSGVVLLLFSRPIAKSTYIAGKLLGIALTLGVLITLTFFLTLVTMLFIPGHILALPDIVRLSYFYVLSLLYLIIFAYAGLFCAILIANETLALFMPILLWVLVTFVLPELVTGQNPVALLNPTNLAQNSGQGTFFHLMHALFYPFSIEQHYTGISQMLLETKKQYQATTPFQIISQMSFSAFSFLFFLLLSLITPILAIKNYKPSKDTLYE